MLDRERIAHELEERLGRDARVVGKGVHQSVEVGGGPRACKIACFWYEDPPLGLALGMNPSNAREGLRPTGSHHRIGAEYLVRFHDAERRVAGGRTQDIAAVIASVHAWLDGASIEEVERASPFVDETRRRMRAVLARIEPACRDVARCEIDRNVGFELWAYGRGRSCQLHPGEDDAVAVSFRLGPAQVAFADAMTDPVTPVSRWLHGATLAELEGLGARIEAHAALLERGDAARWHWLHLRERIQGTGDVLEGSRPLIERLAERPLPTRFFSFSSMTRLCFSASSHYPWVDQGLPVVSPPHGQQGYVVQVDATRTECGIDEAIEVIERALAAYPVAPFFGSAADRTVVALEAELVKAGAPLHAEIRQHSGWFAAAVVQGDRYCTVDDDLRGAAFHDDGERALRASFAAPAETIAAIRHWLEDRYTIEDVEALPSVVKVFRARLTFDPD